MKCILYSKFDSPKNALNVSDVEKPLINDNQVLINVKSSSLNFSDYKRFIEPVNGKPFNEANKQLDTNVLKCFGKIIGMDVAGIVVEIGKNVTNFKVGDEVFAIASNYMGAWAEYVCANENEVCLKPSNLSLIKSAALPTAATVALGSIRLADVKCGQHILVNGASGGIGLFLVQMLKSMGAVVTGVCSTHNVNMVYELGADYVIDYKKDNFLQKESLYDCVFAVNGYQTLEEYRSILKSDGIYVPIGGSQQCAEAAKFGADTFKNSTQKLKMGGFNDFKRELPVIKKMIEDGSVTPVIDDIYSVKNISDAIERIVKNHAKGKIIITMDFK